MLTDGWGGGNGLKLDQGKTNCDPAEATDINLNRES